MKNLSIYLLLALGFISFTAEAQIKLNHVGGGISYWNRTYSGEAENAFLVGYNGDTDFSEGSTMPFITAEVGLWENFAVDARVGIWSADYNNGARFGSDVVVEETIEQTIIPVSGGFVFRWGDMMGGNLEAVAGAGLNRYFVQNRVKRTIYGEDASITDERFSGNDYGGYFKAGLEYGITRQLAIGVEARYNTGGYTQTLARPGDTVPRKYDVSVQGLEAGLSVLYRFDFD